MGRMQYTVTTTTKSCPHCGRILSKTSSGEMTPIIAVCWPVTLPFKLMRALLKYCAFGNPDIPLVGPETISCPSCALPIHTDNVSIDHLDPLQLLNYRFRMWFNTSYILGTIFFFSCLCSFPNAVNYPGFWRVVATLLFIGITIIIVAYRILKNRTNTRKKIPLKQAENKIVPQCLYCRICGKELPADSKFCNSCGTQIAEN